MSPDLLWKNVVAYCLQVGLLVGLAAFVPAALRLRMPRGRLLYWQILLLACLLLPLVQPWRQAVISSSIEMTSVVTAIVPSGVPAPRRIPTSQIALGLLAAGAMARLVWLAVGFSKLWLYRRRSRPLQGAAPWHTSAEIRLSNDVSSPVTFGLRNPVVLVPASFPQMNERARTAILCHELLHVDRRDWLFTVAEELVRSVFWFHPAIWWLLGEIQLAREQAVDREVIEITQAREDYLDALLAIAGAKPRLDLAPAPLFLRKRHLKQRVVSLLKDGRMSRARMASALTGGVAVLIAACWFAVAVFPLSAAPQLVSDASGVSLDLGGATLVHRTGIDYPDTARGLGIQGTVAVEVTLDGAGNVSDARIVSGPQELRKPVLDSVLGWHFAREGAGSRRLLTLSFRTDTPQPPAPAATPIQPARPTARVESPRPVDTRPRVQEVIQTLENIAVNGLSDDARAQVLSHLPVRVGTTFVMGPAFVEAITRAIREVDEHLTMSLSHGPNGGPVLTISSPVPTRIKVGGNVQQAHLIRQPKPVYPPAAKEARIQGVVKLSAVIGKDGTVQQLEVISGHPLLVPSALEAVKGWVYEMTVLNSVPVEVVTQIDVNYTLSQ